MNFIVYSPRVYTYQLRPEKNDTEYGQYTLVRFTFDCENGNLYINSDVGNYFCSFGFDRQEDFMHLMSRIDKQSLLDKLSDKNVFLLDESRNATIKHIEDDGYEWYGIDSEEDWELFKREMTDINVDTDIDIEEAEESFIGQVDGLIPGINLKDIKLEKDYPHEVKVIADLFEKHLQPVIKEDYGD